MTRIFCRLQCAVLMAAVSNGDETGQDGKGGALVLAPALVTYSMKTFNKYNVPCMAPRQVVPWLQ